MTIADRWAALQFDQAVTTFGMIITNAAEEQIQTGDKWVARYELSQLLSDGFILGDGGNSDALPLGGIDGLLFDEVS